MATQSGTSYRLARAGHIFHLSSLAGLRGSAFSSLHCASKFAFEGFSDVLAEKLAPFGARVTIVEPAPFRTDFLSARSLRVSGEREQDYDTVRDGIGARFEARNGRQAGDPAKLARALVELANDPRPPLRFLAGAAVRGRHAKAEPDAYRDGPMGCGRDRYRRRLRRRAAMAAPCPLRHGMAGSEPWRRR
jgi:NAD(P)-dependent dehydrogenase (short-subunit alcohol dehydrogenase family)